MARTKHVPMSGLLVLAVLALAVGVQGCSDDDDGTTSTITPDTVLVQMVPGNDTISADGSDSSLLIVFVSTVGGGPLEGASVRFETTLGGLAGTSLQTITVGTNMDGVATTLLRGTGQAGTATVTAEAEGVVDSAEIEIVAAAP